MLSKEEKLYHALVGLKRTLDDLGVENIKNEIQSKDGTYETVDCYKEIEKCVVDVINNTQPYKFEELHKGMRVWDKKLDFCHEIFEVHEENHTIEIVIVDKQIPYFKVITLGIFEENRFFPVYIGIIQEG